MLMRSSVIEPINAVFDVSGGVIVRGDNILLLNCVFIENFIYYYFYILLFCVLRKH